MIVAKTSGSKKCKHNRVSTRCKENDCIATAFELCKHKRRKTLCKENECIGTATGLCRHLRIKGRCMKEECSLKNTSNCKHNRRKDCCKEPECRDQATGLCKHLNLKNSCNKLECFENSSSLCKHKRRKTTCTHVECEIIATGLCRHKREKKRCHEDECIFTSTGLCKHKRRKELCKEEECILYASRICKHNRVKGTCKKEDCAKNSLKFYCKHKKNKFYCLDLECISSATGICRHRKNRSDCKEPECNGGWKLCKSEGCEKHKINKYRGYCMTCFMSLFPEEPVSRNYKTKEGAVFCHIRQCFPELTIINDRRINGGCSAKRPDFFIELLTHVIIIEVDENGHMAYDQSCEDRRMMQLSEDIAHRPLVFIRFNPDSNSDGPSCWGVDGRGLAVVKKKQAIEWSLNGVKDWQHCALLFAFGALQFLTKQLH